MRTEAAGRWCGATNNSEILIDLLANMCVPVIYTIMFNNMLEINNVRKYTLERFYF